MVLGPVIDTHKCSFRVLGRLPDLCSLKFACRVCRRVETRSAYWLYREMIIK